VNFDEALGWPRRGSEQLGFVYGDWGVKLAESNRCRNTRRAGWRWCGDQRPWREMVLQPWPGELGGLPFSKERQTL